MHLRENAALKNFVRNSLMGLDAKIPAHQLCKVKFCERSVSFVHRGHKLLSACYTRKHLKGKNCRLWKQHNLAALLCSILCATLAVWEETFPASPLGLLGASSSSRTNLQLSGVPSHFSNFTLEQKRTHSHSRRVMFTYSALKKRNSFTSLCKTLSNDLQCDSRQYNFFSYFLSCCTAASSSGRRQKQKNAPFAVWMHLNSCCLILTVIARCCRQRLAQSANRSVGHLCSGVPWVCVYV